MDLFSKCHDFVPLLKKLPIAKGAVFEEEISGVDVYCTIVPFREAPSLPTLNIFAEDGFDNGKLTSPSEAFPNRAFQ